MEITNIGEQPVNLLELTAANLAPLDEAYNEKRLKIYAENALSNSNDSCDCCVDKLLHCCTELNICLTVPSISRWSLNAGGKWVYLRHIHPDYWGAQLINDDACSNCNKCALIPIRVKGKAYSDIGCESCKSDS